MPSNLKAKKIFFYQLIPSKYFKNSKKINKPTLWTEAWESLEWNKIFFSLYLLEKKLNTLVFSFSIEMKISNKKYKLKKKAKKEKGNLLSNLS